jgi:hypothetical protein
VPTFVNPGTGVSKRYPDKTKKEIRVRSGITNSSVYSACVQGSGEIISAEILIRLYGLKGLVNDARR